MLSAKPIFRIDAELADILKFGATPYGERRVIDIRGGRVSGKLNGRILPGGADWQIIRSDGVADIQARLASANGEVAHLKMTFSPDAGLNDIAVVNLVRSDFVPELSLRLDQGCAAGQLIVNLRAEAAPESLKTAVETAVAALARTFPGLRSQLDHLEHFRPGKPQPTHRLLAPT